MKRVKEAGWIVTALSVLISVTFFVWLEYSPPGNVTGDMLAGLIMGLCIFGIIKLWRETIR